MTTIHGQQAFLVRTIETPDRTVAVRDSHGFFVFPGAHGRFDADFVPRRRAMNRKPLWIVLTLILAASISACSSTSHKTTPAAITVAITTAPPASLTVNGTASIAATVTNDTAAAGVDWTCTPADTCGSFNPAHTASAAATVFTASATAGAIVITAASTTTPTITATANVTVNPGHGSA